MAEQPRLSATVENAPSIDLRALWKHVKTHLGMVLLVVVLVEGLVVAATGLTRERQKAFALVRLGEVQGAGAGTQGAVIERLKAEMSGVMDDPVQLRRIAPGERKALREDGIALPVTIELRPAGTVLLVAERDSPEQARVAVGQVMQRLLQLSSDGVARVLGERREHIDLLGRSIAELDEEIRRLTASGGARQGQWPAMVQWSKAASLTKLLELRGDLQGRLILAKVELAQKTIMPLVLAEPVATSPPYQPRWPRNLAYGLLFGVPFGLLVVALRGTLLQLARPGRAAEGVSVP